MILFLLLSDWARVVDIVSLISTQVTPLAMICKVVDEIILASAFSHQLWKNITHALRGTSCRVRNQLVWFKFTEKDFMFDGVYDNWYCSQFDVAFTAKNLCICYIIFFTLWYLIILKYFFILHIWFNDIWYDVSWKEMYYDVKWMHVHEWYAEN